LVPSATTVATGIKGGDVASARQGIGHMTAIGAHRPSPELLQPQPPSRGPGPCMCAIPPTSCPPTSARRPGSAFPLGRRSLLPLPLRRPLLPPPSPHLTPLAPSLGASPRRLHFRPQIHLAKLGKNGMKGAGRQLLVCLLECRFVQG
jgi:hypothetical protein